MRHVHRRHVRLEQPVRRELLARRLRDRLAIGPVQRVRDAHLGDDGRLSDAGRAVKGRVEARTDELAAKPYESLAAGELDELLAALEPRAALLGAAPAW